MTSISLCTPEHIYPHCALFIIYCVNTISLYANTSMPSLCMHHTLHHYAYISIIIPLSIQTVMYTVISIFWLFQQFRFGITELTVQEFILCILLQWIENSPNFWVVFHLCCYHSYLVAASQWFENSRPKIHKKSKNFGLH